MITSLTSLNPMSYGNYVTHGSGKLYVPVNSHYVGYAQFDHVSGISAQHGQQGVPVNKLSILNTLIDRFLSVQSGSSGKVSAEEIEGATDEQLDFPVIYASAKEGWQIADGRYQKPDFRFFFLLNKQRLFHLCSVGNLA